MPIGFNGKIAGYDGGDGKPNKSSSNYEGFKSWCNKQGGIFNLGDNAPTKIENVYLQDGSRVEVKTDKDNNVIQETVYKDIDGDEKEDIYSVKRKNDNGETYTYFDKDGDGFSDIFLVESSVELQLENGNKTNIQSKSEVYVEEDINKLLNPDEGTLVIPARIENRKMKNIYNNYLCK